MNVRALLSLIGYHRAQLDELNGQIAMIDAALREHHRAKETLTHYKALRKGEDLLVPVGADTYVSARVDDPNTALGGIGANIVIEESPDKRIQRIAAAIAELEEAREHARSDIQKISEEIEKLSGLIEREQGAGRAEEIGGEERV